MGYSTSMVLRNQKKLNFSNIIKYALNSSIQYPLYTGIIFIYLEVNEET